MSGSLSADAAGMLEFATEFRIPCPEPADPGRPADKPVLRPEALIVRKCCVGYWATRFPDGWGIFNPNLEPGEQVWTGTAWEYSGQVFAGVKFQWTLEQAIVEAQSLAVEETVRYEAWLADMRAGRDGR